MQGQDVRREYRLRGNQSVAGYAFKTIINLWLAVGYAVNMPARYSFGPTSMCIPLGFSWPAWKSHTAVIPSVLKASVSDREGNCNSFERDGGYMTARLVNRPEKPIAGPGPSSFIPLAIASTCFQPARTRTDRRLYRNRLDSGVSPVYRSNGIEGY